MRLWTCGFDNDSTRMPCSARVVQIPLSVPIFFQIILRQVIWRGWWPIPFCRYYIYLFIRSGRFPTPFGVGIPWFYGRWSGSSCVIGFLISVGVLVRRPLSVILRDRKCPFGPGTLIVCHGWGCEKKVAEWDVLHEKQCFRLTIPIHCPFSQEIRGNAPQTLYSLIVLWRGQFATFHFTLQGM